MFSILAEGGDTPTNWFDQYWILILLVGVLVALYVFSYFRRKKYNQQVAETLNTIKPGTKVKTYSGFYGTVLSIRETSDGKVVLLETGSGTKKSFMEIDINAIYGVDAKEDLVYDAEGNLMNPAGTEPAPQTPKPELSETQQETEKAMEKEKKASSKTKK